MKSPRVLAFIITCEVLAVCACGALLAVLVGMNVLGNAFPQVALVTPLAVTRPPTARPIATDTPAPTFTRVIEPSTPNGTFVPYRVVSPTPTQAGVVYDIIVPTPAAPPMVYPITFDSSFKVVTYPVIGTTLSELQRSLNAQALPDSNDVTGLYYARTQWYLSGRWFTQPTARGCEVESGSVTLAMTMTLPALSSSAGISPQVDNRWNTFVNNTITHETGHVTRNLQSARDYQRDLGNFPPAPDCARIKPQLNDLFNRATAAVRQVNIDYDAQTQHGATQGAVFP